VRRRSRQPPGGSASGARRSTSAEAAKRLGELVRDRLRQAIAELIVEAREILERVPPFAGIDAQGLGSSQVATSGVSIFTAIQEQLGLRLEAGRAPVDVLVVTAVERPTSN